jgi:hypothetical protein
MDELPPPEVDQEMLDAFAEGWASVPEGMSGARRTAGLIAVFKLMRERTNEETDNAETTSSDRSDLTGDSVAGRLPR